MNADVVQIQGGKHGAYATFWATADSLRKVQEIVSQELLRFPEWSFDELYTIERVAFDDRPEEMTSLQLRRTESEIHKITIDPWNASDEDPTRD